MDTNPFEIIYSKLNAIEQLIKNKPTSYKKPVPKEPIRGISGLAKFLKCSPVTAQKLKNSGKIPYSQYGRIVMFDPDKVMEALENRK